MKSVASFLVALSTIFLLAPLSVGAQQSNSETCALDDPTHCSSCRALGATVGKLDDKDLSGGKEVDGVIWTPLFTSYFMNCPEVGRSLVRRGADVGAGGRGGALLAEVATQRALNPDPRNISTNVAWASILEGGRIDLDAPLPGGRSNRRVWQEPREGAGSRYSDIWARFERASVPTPLRPDILDIDPDEPTSATGKTRPAESPVSKGVEKFAATYQKSGMAGLSVEISGCYQWALQIAKASGKRIALEHCAAMDIVSRKFDLAYASEKNFPPSEFFEAAKFDARVNQIRDQNFEGMVWPAYRRNLEASAMLWFGYHAELVEARDAPAPASAKSRPDPGALLAQWNEFNGQCRGGRGDRPETQVACQRREIVGKQLGQAGYCYGQRGEYGYQMKWHACGANSLR